MLQRQLADRSKVLRWTEASCPASRYTAATPAIKVTRVRGRIRSSWTGVTTSRWVAPSSRFLTAGSTSL